MATEDGGGQEPETNPTQPLSHEQPTVQLSSSRTADQKQPAGARCKHGHDQPRNPTIHPTLGMVPAVTSVIFGGIVVVVILLIELWLIPALLVWTLAILGLGLAFSAIVQLVLGHRGKCWFYRTLRWWLGPVGSFIDPFEMG
ncbi:MAG: hypothetical protein K0U64_03635 [Actinomycetia bacterium]|nr:hypothetical protein [Actinomycetes bacterium]